MDIRYIKAQYIGRFAEGCDYGAELIVIARFEDYRLVWKKGAKFWKNHMEGYVYAPGSFAIQSESNGNYFERLRNGIDVDIPVEPDDGDRVRLSKRSAATALLNVKQQVPTFPEFNYKRGFTALIG